MSEIQILERPFLSLCAPAYNEEESIESVVREWAAIIARDNLNAEMVIGNDGSMDRTGEILARLQQEFPNLIIVSHDKNGGYGRALRSAMAEARGEYILTLDSDGQFDAGEWKQLYDKLQAETLDLVTGYRHAKQASFLHVYADRGLNGLIRLMFGLRLRDTNCALKLFRGEVGRALAASGEAMGYPTPTEFLVKAQLLGYRAGEVQITHRDRAGGTTKLKALHTSLTMLQFLLYLRWKQQLFRARILSRP
ncbi:MAG: glycosyltransferase family 2 protein [Ardenticatenales bacterium]|nr:glycosyltransferase family 2 protein [Ardenticatenales bacterium]